MDDKKYSIVRQRSGIWRSLRDGDFEEEEVWAVMKERPENHKNKKKGNEMKGSSPLPFPRSRTLPSAARMIPTRDHSSSSNNSSRASSSHEAKLLRQSAPVNIPDWSKIYMINNNNNNKQKKKHPKNVSKFGDFDFCRSFDDEDNDCDDGDGDDEEGEEPNDEYDCKLPPHEFIARRLARSQISSFSVFEGVGRTLKGRDLSKVRNAVLTKTGFLESL